MIKPQRIAKYIAHAGLCSRRQAEELIFARKVTVDGVIITNPATKVDASNNVTVNGTKIIADTKPRMWIMYKPSGYITSIKDPQNRPTVFDLLPEEIPRVITIGRLDFNTEGLLLLTNNGDLARHIELPKNQWLRTYKVRAFGKIDHNKLQNVISGTSIDGIYYAPAEISITKHTGKNYWLEIKIREGKNREVRKISKYIGLTVNRLIRTSFGRFKLGNLKKSAILEVSEKIVRKVVDESNIR